MDLSVPGLVRSHITSPYGPQPEGGRETVDQVSGSRMYGTDAVRLSC